MSLARLLIPRRKQTVLKYGLFLFVFFAYLWFFLHYLPSDSEESSYLKESESESYHHGRAPGEGPADEEKLHEIMSMEVNPPAMDPDILEESRKMVERESEKKYELRDGKLFVGQHQIPDYSKRRVGPGEQGSAVRLQGEELKLGQESQAKWFMNVVASDKIAMDRSIPDNRHTVCKTVKYPDDLPTASVVIIFHEEAWTPLLRTVHSVINRSPLHLLHEVILYDDASTREELGEKLTQYVKRFGKMVKLIRGTVRQGLVRARLEGAKPATGDVLIFLDSHCEANTGWIEPLLQRIKDKPSAVLVPTIDGIDAWGMSYPSATTNVAIGGFTWSLFFTWFDRRADQGKDKRLTVPTPTMPGGLFAVGREYFWQIGGYDPGMDIWGGENLELSFRTWQCGGSLEMVPCSRVGHIFRSGHPYNMTDKDVHGINSARLAEVWMGDYKRLFYHYRRSLKDAEIGDIKERFEVKERNKCKDFRWYLDNVYPEKRIPDEGVIAYGWIKNPERTLCFDSLQRREKSRINIGIYPCMNGLSAAQFWSYSHKQEIFREDECLEATPQGFLVMDGCTFGVHQKWNHTRDGRLMNVLTKKCLDSEGLSAGEDARLVDCDDEKGTQKWVFEHYLQSETKSP